MKTNTPKQLPPQDELQRLFYFNSESGQLVRLQRPQNDFPTKRAWSVWNSRFAGQPVGCDDGAGYLKVKISGAWYRAHRLIWAYHNVNIPDGLHIDHIDGDRSNNRLENLRVATRAENMRNQRRRHDNASGAPGIYWNKREQKWVARVGLNGERHFLGYFDLVVDAAQARATFCRANGFSERHTNG